MPEEWFYVQVAHNPPLWGSEPEPWQTNSAWLDRADAERMGEQLERASLGVDGEDRSADTVTVARVITAAELLEEGGAVALARAEAATAEQRRVKAQDS